MSLLTGRHPHKQSVWTNDDILASDIPTHAHAIGATGYRPVLAGRLHALGADQHHGYVERLVGDHSPAWPGSPAHGMGSLKGTNGPNRVSIDNSGPGQSAYELLDRDTCAAALDQLDREAERKAGGDGTPFALTVGFMLPHAPYVASQEDYARFRDCVPPPSVTRPDDADEHPWIRKWRTLRGIEDVSDADTQRARAAYYGLTYRLDQNIGRILDRLETLGLADDTLVIYTTDHGDHVGERGLWWKHTFYEDSVKVPLIMRLPGVLPASERRNAVITLLDVAATMLDAAEAPALPMSDGHSFWDVAQDGSVPWDGTAFSEYCTTDAEIFGGTFQQQRMIRTKKWKLIYYRQYPPQLFNMETDPDEANDLASDPAFSKTCDALMARVLEDWDPAAIEQEMRDKQRITRLIRKWAAATVPDNTIRWPLTDEQNYLTS